jgi:hypothetical protein
VQESIKTDLGINVDLSSLKFSAANLPQLRLKNKTFITKASDGTYSTASLFELIVQIPVAGFLINLSVNTGGTISASILNNGGTFDSLAHLLTDAPLGSDAIPSEQGVLDDVILWNLSVQLPQVFDPPDTKITYNIGFIVTLPIPGHSLTVGIGYDSKTQTFTGGLLFQNMFLTRLSPDFDDLKDLPRGMLKNLPPFYDLGSSSPFDSLPSNVPRILTLARISYTKGSQDNPSLLQVSADFASVSSQSTPSDQDSVPFPFDWTEFQLVYRHQGATKAVTAGNSLDIFSSFHLNPNSDRFRSGVMQVVFSYLQGSGAASGGASASNALWSLSASVKFIQLGAIAQFFDPGLSDGVLDMLGKLSIDSLNVSYTYQKDVASSFLFTGALTFGQLRLKLYYQYATEDAAKSGNTAAHQTKAKPGNQDQNLTPIEDTNGLSSYWRLDAYLDTTGPGATIGSIADSIVDDASNNIPSFVSDIEVHPEDSSASLISLHAGKTTKTTSGVTVQRATFLLNVSISTVEFTFAQVSTKGEANSSPNTKRLLRLSVGKLPFIDSLPVVKELPQPYQELQYMWSPSTGLTRDEVAALNEKLELEGSSNQLYFKPATRAATDPNAATDPVVLAEGHHFVIVDDNQAILDHIFEPEPKPASGANAGPNSNGTNSNNQPSAGAVTSQPNPNVSNNGSNDSGTDELPPSKGAMKKHTQFLNISALSLQYKQGHIWIFVDATVTLGPIELALIGFGVGLNVSKLKLNDLSTLLSLADGIDFQLHGMEVAFDNPPILIAGCFYHDVIQRGDQTEDAYRGGIAVSIPPYTFVAVGEYAEVTTKQGSFKSVFIYAKLDGPIIDFEFAILRGLRIGFGYNSMVRSPAVEELYQFPLIDDGAASNTGNVRSTALD